MSVCNEPDIEVMSVNHHLHTEWSYDVDMLYMK